MFNNSSANLSDRVENNQRKEIIELLGRQYPWFTQCEIEAAVNMLGEDPQKLIPYLHHKSGGWSNEDAFEQ
jgi:hypothetical protein